MKSKLILVVLLLLCNLCSAQDFSWVRGGGTNQSLATSYSVEGAYYMCSDYNGNVYSLSIVGNNAITADTFYRPGAFGSSQNVLFTSHNCDGQMRFAKLLSSNSSTVFGVVADTSGHVYVAVDLIHFGTGGSAMRLGYDTTVTTFSNTHVTLIQYDTSGHLNWFRFVGADLPSTYVNTGGRYNYLALDGLNRPHITAATNSGVVLSPSVTSTTGFYDLTYDVLGDIVSVNRLEVDTSLWIDGMTIDKQSGKQYVHGKRNFYLFPSLSRYSYISALSSTGNRIWVDTFVNPLYPNGIDIAKVVADNNGHLYTSIGGPRCLVYRGDTTYNTVSISGLAVIMKLDTGGNLLWKTPFSGSTGTNGFAGLTLFGDRKIAASGVFVGQLVCNTDTMDSYSGEGNSAHFAIIDTSGYLHELKQLHGVGFHDNAQCITTTRNGSLYLGGKLETNIWAGSLPPYTSVGGESDFYVMKYGVNCDCAVMPAANYTHTGSFLTRTFTYTGTVTGIDSVRWTFGDGGTSTTMSPVHTYTGAGTFTACVRIYSSCGNDMRCQEVTVACATSVTSNFVDTGVLIHGFTYTGTTAGYDSVVWDMGDGTSDTGINVWHVYAVADTYHVCATVYTNCGTHTFCKDIYIDVPGAFVADASLEGVRVFPNPSKSELTITNLQEQTGYKIMNLVGVVMQRGTLRRGRNQVNIEALPTGVYLLEMSSAEGSRRVVGVVRE